MSSLKKHNFFRKFDIAHNLHRFTMTFKAATAGKAPSKALPAKKMAVAALTLIIFLKTVMHYFVSDRLNLLETYIGNQLFSYFFLDTP